MAKRQKRQREHVPDYTPAGAPGLRLVVRLFRYEKPPQGTYRQYVIVPGRAAKLTVKSASHAAVLWEHIEDTIKWFAEGIEREG